MAEPTYKHLTISNEDGVRTIVLNRDGSGEKRNSLTREMIGEVSSAFTDAQNDAGVKAVVLRGKEKEGKGGAFSGGIDLPYLQEIMAEPAADKRAALLMPLVELFDQLDRFTKPMIGVADGPAVGAGATLLELCDHVIATPDLKIGYPEVKMGLFPSLSGVYAIRRIGSATAESWFTSGKIYNAGDARDRAGISSSGLVDTMVSSDNPGTINSAISAVLKNAREAGFVKYSSKKNLIQSTSFRVDDTPHGKVAALINEVTQRYQDRSPQGRAAFMAFGAGHLADAMPAARPVLETYVAALASRSLKQPASTRLG